MWARIKEEFRVELERYSRTKYGKITAFMLLYLIFQYFPIGIQYLLFQITPKFTPFEIYVIIFMLVGGGVIIFFNVSMYFIYKYKFPFFQQYRINPETLWPWQINYEDWKKTLIKSLKLTFLSFCIFTPILLVISSKLNFQIDVNPEKLPPFTDVFIQLLIMLVLEDMFFYFVHSSLHHPKLYFIHKIHHQYTTSVSIAGLHSHYLEYLFSNSIPAGIYFNAAMLYKPLHISTIAIFILYRFIDAFNGHCGYSFSWSLTQIVPFCTNDQFHDFHHSKNSGNYGSLFRFWDTVFDTNLKFRQHKMNHLKKKQA